MTDIEIIKAIEAKYLPGLYEGVLIPHGPFLEEWKLIEGLKYDYFISNYGRIKNHKGLIMKVSIEDGYHRIILRDPNDKKLHFAVHRLVGQYFIHNPKDKRCINHIRGIRNNNLFTQLEWATHSENNLHTARVMKREFPNKKCGKYQFLKTTIYIATHLETGDIKRFLGETEFKAAGFQQSAVNMCLTGRRNSHHGYTWHREKLPGKKRYIKLTPNNKIPSLL